MRKGLILTLTIVLSTCFAVGISFGPTQANAQPMGINIDIKPGSDPNPIDLKSKGLIPVAILTTEAFDAATVDADSVMFGPGGSVKAHKKAHLEDVDQDGDQDLLLHFGTQESGIAAGDTEACLQGSTFDGIPIMGCDSVRTTPE